MKNKTLIAVVSLGIVAAVALWFTGGSTDKHGQGEEIVINEAVRTLLYLPLYHAQHHGFFEEAGVPVKIETGGTATASFAAMLSGDAEFSQADPMYVPIAREKGSDTKVVAQVVARIAVWGLTMDPELKEITAENLKGKKISTHPAPMTAYTYTTKLITDLGLTPDKDVGIISSSPGTEIAPLLNGQSDFAMTLEPSTSKAVLQGARVVFSYPKVLGDQVFTGLMTTESFIDGHPKVVSAVVDAYQKALEDIRTNPEAALKTAEAYFPGEDKHLLQTAIRRMMEEKVIPRTVLISEESWKKAIAVRVAVGDLKAESPREENCALAIMKGAQSQ